MNEPTRYEIVVRGRATERLLRPLLDDFVVDHTVPGHTRLTGVVRDPAHLHGVMAHLTSVAAEVVSLTPADPKPTETDIPTNKPDRQAKSTTKNERHNQ